MKPQIYHYPRRRDYFRAITSAGILIMSALITAAAFGLAIYAAINLIK